jgi:putative membrane protein
VLDWLRVFNATTDYATLNGEPADVIGFVYTEPDMAPTQFMVARFTVSCCVADANAIGVPVHWNEADVAALASGQWVRVTGAMQVESFRGDDMPVLQAQAVELIEAPKNPYLFP